MNAALSEALEAVAAATPAPGGGTTAGWTCALAAALVQMTARFTQARADASERHARMAQIDAEAGALRERALNVAERELTAFEPVLTALRLPHEAPGRDERVAEALSTAAQTPFELCQIAHEVTLLAAEAARDGTHHLRGDARTGLLLAKAACAAAAGLVAINLEGRPDDPRLTEAARLSEEASALTRS